VLKKVFLNTQINTLVERIEYEIGFPKLVDEEYLQKVEEPKNVLLNTTMTQSMF